MNKYCGPRIPKINQALREEGLVIEKYEPFWSVWRQDDSGNAFLVKNGLTKIDAFRLVRDFERKGHKQTYWAKNIHE